MPVQIFEKLVFVLHNQLFKMDDVVLKMTQKSK